MEWLGCRCSVVMICWRRVVHCKEEEENQLIYVFAGVQFSQIGGSVFYIVFSGGRKLITRHLVQLNGYTNCQSAYLIIWNRYADQRAITYNSNSFDNLIDEQCIKVHNQRNYIAHKCRNVNFVSHKCRITLMINSHRLFHKFPIVVAQMHLSVSQFQ